MGKLSLPFSTPPSKNGKFGPRTITLSGKRVVHLHDGTDWPTGYGTPLRAMGDGVISFKTYTALRGHQVGVRHPDGSETGFNLCREASPLPVGRAVKAGDVIARSGPHPGWEKSGAAATGAHTHAWLKLPGIGFVDMMARLKYTLDAPSFGASNPFDNTEVDDMPDMNEFLNTPAYTGGPTISSLFKAVDERTMPAIAQAVWQTPVRRGDVQVSALQELADAKTIVIRLEAQNAALVKALSLAAAGSPIDVSVIRAEARAGAEEALANLTLTAKAS